ncbi:unnamed protein product [Schistosoma turkestanicum]|nr:unnamed protein product [Schistosoma turkestanicum]
MFHTHIRSSFLINPPYFVFGFDAFRPSESSFNETVETNSSIHSTVDLAPIDDMTNDNFTTTDTDTIAATSSTSTNTTISTTTTITTTTNINNTATTTDTDTNSSITDTVTTDATSATSEVNQSKSFFNEKVETLSSDHVTVDLTPTNSVTNNTFTTTDTDTTDATSSTIATTTISTTTAIATTNTNNTVTTTDNDTNSSITDTVTNNTTTATDKVNESKSSFNETMETNISHHATFDVTPTDAVTNNAVTTTDNDTTATTNTTTSATTTISTTTTTINTNCTTDTDTNSLITDTVPINTTTATDEANQSNTVEYSRLLPPDNVTITNITSDSFVILWHLSISPSRSSAFAYEILINSPQRPAIIIIKKNASNSFQLNERIDNLTSCSFYVVQIKIHDLTRMKSSDWSMPVLTTTLMPHHIIQTYFEVENLTPISQKVKWSKLCIPNECIALIQLVQINAKTFHEFTINLPINETEYTFDNLVPSTQYTYQLKVISPFGNYLRHYISITTTTTTTTLPLPHLFNTSIKPPKHIQIFNITSNSFMINWSTVKTTANNNNSELENSTYAEILINTQNQSSSTLLSSLFIKNISNELVQTKIDNLTACSMYTIQMRLVVKFGDTIYSDWSKPITVFTSIPNITKNISLEIRNSGRNLQQLQWIQLNDSDFLENQCKSYLEVIRCAHHVSYHCVKVNLFVNETTYLFDNLKPLTMYTYSMNLISPFGNISNIYMRSTTETLPNGPNAPVNLSISHISSNKLTLHWQNPPSSQHPSFNVQCFFIYKRESIDWFGAVDEYKICNNNDNLNQFNITSLIPGRQYTFYMKSQDTVHGLHSDMSNVISATTYPSKPNPPINLTVIHILSNQLTIQWTEPSTIQDSSAFQIQQYFIYYRLTLNVNAPFTIESSTISSKNHHFNTHRISSLLPGRYYTVFMKSYDSIYGLYSNASKSIIVYTYPDTPDPPVNVTFIEIRSTQLRVVWTPPPTTTQNNSAFKINCYLVNIRPTFNIFSQQFQQFNVCHSNVYNIKSLLPGVNYTVYVKSFDSIYGIESSPSNYITAITYPDKPMPPENLTAVNIKSSQFTIQWSHSRSDVTFTHICYVIYVRPTLHINDPFQQYNNICTEHNQYTLSSLLFQTHYTVYLKSFDQNYGLYSDATKSLLIYTYPTYLQLPVNITISHIDVYGFTIHWNHHHPSIIHDRTLDNKFYYYVFIKPLDDRTNEAIMKFNAGLLTTNFHISNLSSNTWYAVYLQSIYITTDYQISSIKSEEIFVRTYPETIQRDSLNQLTNLALQIPSNQPAETSLQKDTMISLYLPLSKLNDLKPKIYIVSLVVKPTRKDDELICSEGCTMKMNYTDINDLNLIESVSEVLYEDDISKCCQYWPNDIHESLTFQSDCLKLEVTLLSEEDHHMYILRKLYITSSINSRLNKSTINGKYVIQLHMTTWPDFDVPKLNEFQLFMKDYHEIKCNESHRDSPTLVHCTAGVGRTGTFIIADLLQQYKESNCMYYDIPGMILQLRRCRPSMVQKVAQYIFLYQYAYTLFQ